MHNQRGVVDVTLDEVTRITTIRTQGTLNVDFAVVWFDVRGGGGGGDGASELNNDGRAYLPGVKLPKFDRRSVSGAKPTVNYKTHRLFCDERFGSLTFVEYTMRECKYTCS